ncbi:Protein of unknown function, partial [Gryllus bimaculatus]
GLL